MGRDFFEVLGVPRKYHLPQEELEARYKELSKQVHPDRFAKAPPRERLQAVQKTTELNDAWRVLRDPVKRAEYLLKLEGLDVADEKSASVKADPGLLMEMLEKNEQLHEAKALGDTARIVALEEEVRLARVNALEDVHEGFTIYDNGDRSSLTPIAQALVALRYHDRFLALVEAWQTGRELEPTP
jgi:molecular chaperone HscB